MKLSPEDNNGTEDSAQTDNNSHFNSSRPGSSGTNIRNQLIKNKWTSFLTSPCGMVHAGSIHPSLTRNSQIIVHKLIENLDTKT